MAVRTAMEHPIGALPRTPFPASRDFPSRGNEKIGSTGYCVTYDTDSQYRNVLASPLGEEGHEVAKGWTVVRMIMRYSYSMSYRPPKGETTHYILRVAGDTTLLHNPRRQPPPFFKICARRAIRNPRPERPSNLRTLRPSGRSILRTFSFTSLLQSKSKLYFFASLFFTSLLYT